MTDGTDCDCLSTMSLIDSEPLTSTTPTSARPSTSSYDTTCAPPRKAPSREYFDPEDQPPSTMPYTPSELAPIRYSRATGMSWMIRSIVRPPMVIGGPIGMTAKDASAAISDIPGASGYRKRSAIAGRTSSLKNSFNASASGCSNPVGPTRFGPMRTCRRLMARRSNQVMYAMPVSRAKMMMSDRTTSITRSDTRDQHLRAQGIGDPWVLVGDE